MQVLVLKIFHDDDFIYLIVFFSIDLQRSSMIYEKRNDWNFSNEYH